MTSTRTPDQLIAAFAALARQPHVAPTLPASVEVDWQRRVWRRAAQSRFDVVGLPRGLAKVA